MSEPRLRGIYAVTDGQLAGKSLLAAVEQALAGGVRLLQYRNKSGDAEQHRQEAGALRKLCDRYGAMLLINDDAQLAREIDADGVHLGQNDTPIETARRTLGAEKIIGISCNNRLEWALRAAQQGADYVAFGRFFPSMSKPDAPQAQLALLEQARQQLDLPIAAIGGITPDNAPRLRDAGADMLAVIHGLFGQDDIETAARQLSRCCE